MKLQQKSSDQEIEIEDFYKIKIGALWEQLKKEHFSFWALNAYFFFEYVRPQSIYTKIDILPWSQLTLLLAIVSAFLDPSVKWVGSGLNKLMFAFSIVLVLSGLFSDYPLPSWDAYTVFINWFIVYFLLVTVINTERRFFIFMLAYLLYNYKMSQHGLIEWARRGFAFTDWGLQGPPGWFTNSGEYAIQMLIFIPVSIAFCIALRSYWGTVKRWFFYLMPISAAFTVMGCSSRGAQLSLGLIALWVVLRSKAGIKGVLAILILGYGLYNLIPEEQMGRFESMGEDTTSLQRLAYWEAGLDFMSKEPVFGIGYDNWLKHMWVIHPSGVGPFRDNQLPHNIFIEVGAELGYTGLLIAVMMMVAVFVTNAATRKIAIEIDNKFFGYTAFALDAGLLGFMVAGFFVTVFYYPFFWVQMGMTVALYSIAKQQQLSLKTKVTKSVDADAGMEGRPVGSRFGEVK